MAEFPSVEWFEAVRTVFNGDSTYRGAGGGRCNCRFAVKVGKRAFALQFEGFECSPAVELANGQPDDDLDFYLEMDPADWRAMVEDIAANGSASLHYTLNTLDLDREEGLSRSTHGDQYREDLFFRYNQTMQFFFDASARVPTTFAERS
jgi:hypothetical protein